MPLPGSLEKLIAIESVMTLAPDAVRRLGALALFLTEDAERLIQWLRMSNGECQRLLSMADGWWRTTRDMSPAEAKTLIYRIGPGTFR